MYESYSLKSFYDGLLWMLGQNLVVSSAMIPIVWLLCRCFRKRPAVQHLLWLIVLIKLVTPPLPGLSWQLPEFAKPDVVQRHDVIVPLDAEALMDASIIFEQQVPSESQYVVDDSLERPLEQATNPVDAKPVDAKPYDALLLLNLLLLAVWSAGASIWMVVQFRKTWRCYRLVGRGSGASVRLAGIVGRVAKRMGLKRLETRVVSRIASPFLCCVGRVRLAWPQSLQSLDEASIAVIVAHESAHLRRRDHWVAWVELAASILWWWHPLFWFVRRQLRNAAELSCDAMALEAYPEDRCLYAETLLWLSAGIKAGAPPLQLAIGSGAPSSIERRIHMIATDHVSGKLSIAGAVFAALLVLGSLPGWSLAQSEVGKSETAFEEGGIGLTAAIGFVEASEQSIDGTPETIIEGGGAPSQASGEFVVEEKPSDLAATATAPGGEASLAAEMMLQAAGGGGLATGTMPGGAPAPGTTQAVGSPSASSLARQVLRIKAMHLIAMSENRTADAEALATAIRILEASPEVATKVAKMEMVIATDKLYGAGSKDFTDKVEMDPLKGPLAFKFKSVNPLRGYNSLAIRHKVTGSNVGTIWGTDVYTDDSPAGVAAVHAGLLKVGETKEIVMIVEAGRERYAGFERNGIASMEYGSWPGSYRLTAVEDAPGVPYFCHRMMSKNRSNNDLFLEALHEQAPLQPGTTLIVPLVGSTAGAVWGNGIYTADSSLDAAAVHAGLLAPGQAGLCKIMILEGRDSYNGSTANGVSTRTYGPWDMSFKIEPLPKVDVRKEPRLGLQY